MNWLLELASLGNLAAFANSAFATSLVGAVAGAFAGAKGAQIIAERSKERGELQLQIRNTNAAITLSFMVCNAAIGLKGQHTKALCDTYFKRKEELDGFLQQRMSGEVSLDVAFVFKADLQMVQFPEVPIDALRSLVYEKLSVSGRPLALVAALAGAITSLGETIANRNGLIASFKQLHPQALEKALPALYFGKPYGEGNVSTEYHDTMAGLQSQIDDVIFFSYQLCKDLEKHGNKVLDQLKSRFKAGIEKIDAVSMSAEKTAGLMPDPKLYLDWLEAFPEREPS